MDTKTRILSFLESSGQLVLLSICWAICCIPVVTIGPACCALYYSAVKTVRCKYGSLFTNFFRSFRENLRVGIPVGIILVLYLFLSANAVLFAIESSMPGPLRVALGAVGIIFLFLVLLIMSCIFHLLSRFNLKIGISIKASVTFAISNWACTVVNLLIIIISILMLYLLPPFFVWVPGTAAYLTSFRFEKALKSFMKTTSLEATDETWIDELQ